MTKPAFSLVFAAVAVLGLSACSSGDSTQKTAQSQLTAIESAVAQGASAAAAEAGTIASAAADSTASADDSAPTDASSADSAPSSSTAGAKVDPATVDVCALLSPADAQSVAKADGLGAFTAEKDDRGIPGSSACLFSFGGSAKSVIMEVRDGRFIGEYNFDPKVDGLGDEAYDDGTSPAMRVGDLLVTAEMDKLSDAVTLDLLRKIAPHMK